MLPSRIRTPLLRDWQSSQSRRAQVLLCPCLRLQHSSGRRGSALSGGQRQRIASLVWFTRSTPAVVVSKATSALDYSTERQVCLNLASAFRDRTVFFITHRLATISRADVILMMNQGKWWSRGRMQNLWRLRALLLSLPATGSSTVTIKKQPPIPCMRRSMNTNNGSKLAAHPMG